MITAGDVMKSVGIICEYNPFHYGHLYHLNETKKMFPDRCMILVMPGNFVQRGTPAIIDKWQRTKIALAYGIDLVIELPFPFATQSADYFAKGAIEILHALQVEHIVFGSESNEVATLTRCAKWQLEHPEYQITVKNYQKAGYNYPTAMAKALQKEAITLTEQPNDILGMSYIREIIKQQANITPHTIQRTSNYHDIEITGQISSATSLRNAFKEGKDITPYIPEKARSKGKVHWMEDYFPFLRYQGIQVKDLSIYQTVEEGMDKKVRNVLTTVSNYEEAIQKLHTKHYTLAKARRMLLHILCQFTKEEANQFSHVTYLHILGFSTKGQKYLHMIKKECPLPLVTHYGKCQDPMFLLEERVDQIYHLVDPNAIPEYKQKPIRMD